MSSENRVARALCETLHPLLEGTGPCADCIRGAEGVNQALEIVIDDVRKPFVELLVRWVDDDADETVVGELRDAIMSSKGRSKARRDPRAARRRFFWMMTRPHEWSSGPVMSTTDPDTGEIINNLEHAKRVALEKRAGLPGRAGWVHTTYGIEYQVRGLDEE